MALWLFVLLMLLLFLLVAAAVVVPVILLVVVPDSDSHSTSTAGTCQGKLTCQNGGATILSSSGTCQCLCVNGYTGLNCTDHSEQGCTTASIGTTDNATVGNAIPRLISGSGNYSIPLDGESLLGLFSASNLDCAAQNALITFNSASSKRDAIKAREPQAINTGDSVTSEGIIFASGTPTATSSSSTATSTSTGLIDNAATIDFARVAVLYVLQASGQLNTASTAQTDLQKYFRNGENANGGTADAKNITLGNGYTCDLTGYTISLSNGTTVGGSS